MEWEEINEPTDTWLIPGNRTKNGKAHIVHLSAQTAALLRQMRRNGNHSFCDRQRKSVSKFWQSKTGIGQIVRYQQLARA